MALTVTKQPFTSAPHVDTLHVVEVTCFNAKSFAITIYACDKIFVCWQAIPLNTTVLIARENWILFVGDSVHVIDNIEIRCVVSNFFLY